MSPLDEQDSDSDSSSCDMNRFGAVCDPTLESVYLRTKNVNVDDFIAPVERVTGDVDVDSALRDIKKACRSFTCSRNLTAEVPSTMSRSVRARTTGPSFLLSLANSMLEKRVLLQAKTEHQPEPSSAASHVHVHANGDVEGFQLLPDVSVSSRGDDEAQPRVSPAWIRKLQRRHDFPFFHPDEEECLEERCKEVAISAEFIANRGLEIPYAEHRNINPKKLILIPVTPTGTRDTKKSEPNFTSMDASDTTTVDLSVNKQLKDKNQNKVNELKNSNEVQKLSLPQAKTEQNNGISSEQSSSKKKKARKRGPKKGRKRAKLS